MTTSAEIALLWIGFAGTHVGLASVRVEPRLRRALGDAAFVALYSTLAVVLFVPLVWIYFANRGAGEALWVVPVGAGLRLLLYAGMTFAMVLIVGSLLRPGPAALVPGRAEPRGVHRITRHPLVLGIGLVMLLHLIPGPGPSDLAFFGGFVVFALLGAWHQDRRKLHAGAPGFRSFYEKTPFLPFAHRESLRGLREIPAVTLIVGVLAALAIRWLHGSIWPP